MWEVESGDWTVVVMNADASRGVDVDARLGIKVGWLLPVAIGLLAVGLVALAGGTWLIIAGSRGAEPAAEPPVDAAAAGGWAAPTGAGPVAGLAGAADRGDGPAPEPRSVAGEVAAGDPALRGAGVPVARLRRADRRGLLRRAVHGALPARAVRRSTSACCGGAGGSASTRSARSAPTATRRSRCGRPTTRPSSTVAYPEHLSRGLVLVKWWLLAIPHYLVIGLMGSGLVARLGATPTRAGLGRERARPDRAARPVRRCRPAVQRPLPAGDLRLRDGHEPVDLPRGRVRRADDRPVPAVPPRSGRRRARRRGCDGPSAGAVSVDGVIGHARGEHEVHHGRVTLPRRSS